MSSRTETPRAWTWVVGLTLLVALVLRAWALDSGLWYDEIVTLVLSARKPLGTIVTAFPGVNQHPLYSVLAHLSLTWLGEAHWTVRLPAMLAGVATIAATWVLARRLLTDVEAWAATAVLATSYHHIWFSQNARGYTLLSCLAVVSTGLLLRALDSPRPRQLVAYAVVAALGVYTHLTMALVVAGQAAVLAGCIIFRVPAAARWPVGRLLAAGAGASGLSLLAYAPFAADVLRAVNAPAPKQAAQVATAEWAVSEALRALFEGAGGVATVVGVLLALVGGLSLLRRRPIETFVLAMPAVTTLGALVGLGQPVRPRFFFFMAGAAALCVARGLGVMAEGVLRSDTHLKAGTTPSYDARIRRQTLLVVVTTLLFVAVSVPALPRNYRVPKQDFDGAVAWLDARVREGAVAAVAPPACLPLREYYQRAWPCVEHEPDLSRLAASSDVLVLYTLPDYIGDASLTTRLTTACPVLATFPGTLGGGDIVVCRAASTPTSGGRP